MVANENIRIAARDANIKLWQIAQELGINDGNFSRRLRRELPEGEALEIAEIIKKLKRRRA